MSAQERLALIWRPGFSPPPSRSPPCPGRGMGMKSVQDDINSLQGRVEIQSEVGKGTTFIILLPRSLAMMRVMVLREGKDLLAVPITQLVGTHPVPYAAGVQRGECGADRAPRADRVRSPPGRGSGGGRRVRPGAADGGRRAGVVGCWWTR